jgi:hypothetical protein
MSEQIDTTAETATKLRYDGFGPNINRKNLFGFPRFYSHGTRTGKGDLLVVNPTYADLLYKNDPALTFVLKPYAFFVELKSGDDLGDLIKAINQMKDQWIRFVTSQIQFYTDDGTIPRLQFILLATKYSNSGALYKRDIETPLLAWDWITPTFGLLDYPIDRTISSMLFQAKHQCLEAVQHRLNLDAKAPSCVPEFGVMKRGIQVNGQLTPHFMAFLPNRIVPLVGNLNTTQGVPEHQIHEGAVI